MIPPVWRSAWRKPELETVLPPGGEASAVSVGGERSGGERRAVVAGCAGECAAACAIAHEKDRSAEDAALVGSNAPQSYSGAPLVFASASSDPDDCGGATLLARVGVKQVTLSKAKEATAFIQSINCFLTALGQRG